MQTLGPYTLEGELGRGGAGVVHRARDAAGDVVALKVLLRRASADERTSRRFAREARVLERLRHPAIVSVRATGEERGALWVAMDFVEGRTLQERLDREGPLAPREAASLVLELARAVEHVHAEGVLHRDIKPSNVLLDRGGRPFLTDFGLAKDLAGTLHGAGSLSATGQFLGTPGYWPPEQARGDGGAIGPAADVYGLGGTLYAALTGRPPVQVESLVEAFAAAEREVDPPSAHRAGIPPALEAICARALRRAPEDRHDSAEALAEALEAFLAVRRPRRGRRRGWLLAAVPAAGLALAVGLALRPRAPAAPTADPMPVAAIAPSAASDRATTLTRARGLLESGDAAGATALFAPLLADPGDLSADELLPPALAAGEMAFPAARRSLLTVAPPPADPEEAVRATEYFGKVATFDAVPPPRHTARALVGLARVINTKLTESGVLGALTRATDHGGATALPWLALAEYHLGRGSPREADAALARGLDAGDPDPAVARRLQLLREAIGVEDVLAKGQQSEALAAAHALVVSLEDRDDWTRALRDHARAQRLRALGLPAPSGDRSLSTDEIRRLADELARGAGAVVLEVLADLPASARDQDDVIELHAAALLDQGTRLSTSDPAAARAHREQALSLLTPPRKTTGRVARADTLSELERWEEAVAEYRAALDADPALGPSIRREVMIAMGQAHPFLGRPLFAPSDPSAVAAARDAAAVLRALFLPDEEPNAGRRAALMLTAQALHAAGDDAAGDALLARAAAELPESLPVKVLLAERALAREDPVTAHRLLTEVTPRMGGAPTELRIAARAMELLALAEACALRGDARAARAAVYDLDRHTHGWQGPYADDILRRVNALRARLDAGR